jgi:hypothetical protein
MISIVVCSLSESLLNQLKKNVAETIGVQFEILVWENKQPNLGICEVYNQVAADASFPFILFLHEDVTFNTMGWGKKVLQYFQGDASLGLIGIAGSKYKAKFISGWYTGDEEMDVYNVIHKNGQDIEVITNIPKNERAGQQVVCIDGVFMLCRKEVWQQVKFRNELLKGFHFYDIDFSVRVAEKWKVMVVTDVELVHYTTGGDFGDKWVEQAFVYYQNESALFPLSVGPISDNMEIVVAKCWLDWLKGKEISFSHRMRWIMVQKLYTYPGLWYSIIKFFAYRPFRLAYFHKLLKNK